MEKKILKKKTLKPLLKAAAKIKFKIKRPRVAKIEPKPVKFGLHNLVCPKGAHQKKRILGRGSSSGHGKTSSRGSKGQTSRAGRDMYLGFEGGQTPIIRRMPKRGFSNISFKKEYAIVNIQDLAKLKETNITIEFLREEGLVKGANNLVKILGDGELKTAINIKAHAFSRKAQEKIKKAGGTFEVLNV